MLAAQFIQTMANLKVIFKINKEGKPDSGQNPFFVESVLDLLQLHNLLFVKNLQGMVRFLSLVVNQHYASK